MKYTILLLLTFVSIAAKAQMMPQIFDKYLDHIVSKDTLDISRNLHELNHNQLRIMRNLVFAQKGYVFKSPFLKEYFSTKDWYSESIVDSDEIVLTDSEKRFVQEIVEREPAVRPLKSADLDSFPKILRGKIVYDLPDAGSIHAAIKIANLSDNDSEVWLLSLGLRRTVTRNAKEGPYGTERLAGGRWLEAVRVTADTLIFLPFDFRRREDYYQGSGLDGSYGIYASTVDYLVDYELHEFDRPYKDDKVQYFWMYAENPNQVQFIEGHCCCGADCTKKLMVVNVGQDSVKLAWSDTIY